MYDCNNGQSRHHLRVQVEAGVPYIEEGRQSMVLDVQEGRQAEVHCVSQGGRPAAEIEWRRDGQPVNELDRIFEEVTGAGGVGRLMANAILNFHFDYSNPSLILAAGGMIP